MSQERDFKGIWIPKEVWLSQELTLQEKVFLVEVNSLDNDKGCFASNQYFADFFGISTRRVTSIMSSLINKGFITSTIDKSDANKRTIKTLWNKTSIPYRTKLLYPIEGKFQHNNTISNTDIKVNTLVEDLISYINNRYGRKFKVFTSLNSKMNARLKEGYTLDDIKDAVDNAYMDEYHKSVNYKYLSPEFFMRPDKIDRWANADNKVAGTRPPEDMPWIEWQWTNKEEGRGWWWDTKNSKQWKPKTN